MDLYARLRSRAVLHRSWAKVQTNGLKSESERTRRLTRQFEDNWLNNLERIRHKSKNNNFEFTGEKGIAPPKGKGKTGVRPLVLAPISNRVVRRAILEVLQGYGGPEDKRHRRSQGVQAVRSIMDTRTSIGGIVGRGVPEGLALVDHAVREKKNWFVRSDIKDFFTRIPQCEVNNFIRDAVCDVQFSNFFEKSLATHLTNQEELEERNLFKLFPNPEIGVAQGSALSALAGNISLQDFDAKMNGRGIVCIRYIDDFIVLGPSEAKALAAYRSARSMLRERGMDIYDLDDRNAHSAGKVDHGNIHNGTDFLGYTISARSRQPCKAARKKFLSKLDAVVKTARREMKAARECSSVSRRHCYHQSMVELHNIVWGWSQSFRHTTNKQVFEQLDQEVDRRIRALKAAADSLITAGGVRSRRRVMGIHLLAETQEEPLPKITV